MYEVEFRSPVSVKQCYNCQSLGHSAKTCWSKQKYLICSEYHSHKAYPRKAKCANCKGHMLHLTKGVRNTKNRHSGNMWSMTKKAYASIVSQNTLPQPKATSEVFTLTAKQLNKFVATVIIQIAQPQVCYPNPKQDTLDL